MTDLIVRALIRLAVTSFVSIAVLMHVTGIPVNPLDTGISRYQIGSYGYLMSIGFVCLGVAIGGAGYRVRRHGRNGSVLLFGAAVAGFVVAAVPDPQFEWYTRAVIHQLAGFTMFVGAIGGAAAATGAFQPDPRQRFFGAAAVLFARIAAGVGALFILSIALRATALGEILGLLQRITAAAICAWLFVVGGFDEEERPTSRRPPPPASIFP